MTSLTDDLHDVLGHRMLPVATGLWFSERAYVAYIPGGVIGASNEVWVSCFGETTVKSYLTSDVAADRRYNNFSAWLIEWVFQNKYVPAVKWFGFLPGVSGREHRGE